MKTKLQFLRNLRPGRIDVLGIDTAQGVKTLILAVAEDGTEIGIGGIDWKFDRPLDDGIAVISTAPEQSMKEQVEQVFAEKAESKQPFCETCGSRVSLRPIKILLMGKVCSSKSWASDLLAPVRFCSRCIIRNGFRIAGVAGCTINFHGSTKRRPRKNVSKAQKAKNQP